MSRFKLDRELAKLESEFLKFNSQVNTILENAGYGKNFYKLYNCLQWNNAILLIL